MNCVRRDVLLGAAVVGLIAGNAYRGQWLGVALWAALLAASLAWVHGRSRR